MGILISLIKQIGSWDLVSKLALGLDLVLLFAAMCIAAFLPDLRVFGFISSAGLVIVLQIIVLWGNRHLVTPYTEAQRCFLEGDFESTRDILKAYVDGRNATNKRPSIDALVLLGNAYRNLKQLRESESILRLALAQRPNYHFALYGLGKIRLAMGDYREAIKHFQNALAHGAPDVVHFDLGVATYFLGDHERAFELFERIGTIEENYRRFMVLLLTGDDKACGTQLIADGLLFWEAELERVGDTPYGQDLRRELARVAMP